MEFDSGRIEPGKRADLVLLDLDAYIDNATFEDPFRFCDGVHTVWVAGEAVWRDGAATGPRPARVVREPR